ncbi:Brain-specific angiogenesis inhibitor 1-associated protein 2, partial [Bienertia sinuspersici]
TWEEINKLFSEGENLTESNEVLLGLISNSSDSKDVLRLSKELKEEGNILFKQRKIEDALENYGYVGVILTRVLKPRNQELNVKLEQVKSSLHKEKSKKHSHGDVLIRLRGGLPSLKKMVNDFNATDRKEIDGSYAIEDNGLQGCSSVQGDNTMTIIMDEETRENVKNKDACEEKSLDEAS